MTALRRALVAATVCVVASACYSYRNVAASDARVGDGLRVRISLAEAERLEQIFGRGERQLEGDLLEQRDTALVLAVGTPMTMGGGATSIGQAHQRIIIPTTELQEVERRTLDRTRTSLLVGAGVVVTAVVAASLDAKIFGGGDGKGNPNNSRAPIPITLLRVPVGR